MRTSPSDRPVRARVALCAALVALAVGGGEAQAQDAAIVSKAVTFGTNEAALRLEVTDGRDLEVRFANGEVTLDGTAIGDYAREGALVESWRALLTRAVRLDGGPLRDALVAWEPPRRFAGTGERAGGEDEVGAAVHAALEALLAAPQSGPAGAPDAPPTSPEPPGAPATRPERTVTQLLSRLDLLEGLSTLIGEVRVDDLRVVVGEDFEIGPGMVLDGSLLVIDGDVEIAGRIDGTLLVAGGDIEFRSGGVVTGDLRYSDGYLDLDDGVVQGEIAEIEGERLTVDPSVEEELRDRVRSELRAELRAERPQPRRIGILRRIGRTIEEIFELLATAFVLGLFGVLVNFFAERRVDLVAEAARRAPGRASIVGFAAGFLSLPIYVLGIIVLAVSLIGIPLLLVWLPGFPLAVVLAAGLGYVAVARNVGSWITRQNIPGFEWMSVTRPNSLIFGGVLLLLAPHFVATLLGLAGGWFDGLRGLATFVGVMAGLTAVVIGFGAVLITRAGGRSEFDSEEWYSDLRDLGADLGDLRGFASGIGRSWTGGGTTSDADETGDDPDDQRDDPDDQRDDPDTPKKGGAA